MNKLRSLVKEGLSGYKAWQHANYITQFMRTPGSTGIDNTIEYARKNLKKYVLDRVYSIIVFVIIVWTDLTGQTFKTVLKKYIHA